jgi:hypothetical protein
MKTHHPLICAAAVAAPILCRGTVQLAPTATGVMMYMPGGTHEIVPSQNGKAVRVSVLADRAGAAALEAQRAAIVARGGRPFFDFGHKDEEASFWPEEFMWQDSPEPAIYCRGEWTDEGKQAVEGKRWRCFSPVFHVDDVKAKPARIICQPFATPNMGGLVNQPAFRAIAPLFSGEADPAEAAHRERIAALRGDIARLEREIRTLID